MESSSSDSRPVFRSVKSPWRRDALRTNLWLVPTIEVIAAVGLFAVTYRDRPGGLPGKLTLPEWVNNGSADASRQILIGIAAAVDHRGRAGVLDHDRGAHSRHRRSSVRAHVAQLHP